MFVLHFFFKKVAFGYCKDTVTVLYLNRKDYRTQTEGSRKMREFFKNPSDYAAELLAAYEGDAYSAKAEFAAWATEYGAPRGWRRDVKAAIDEAVAWEKDAINYGPEVGAIFNLAA